MQFEHKYRFLSNMYECDIKIKNITFKSAEQAFQFYKCDNEADRNIILNCRNPLQAKTKGRAISMRDNWHDIRIKVMQAILEHKFEQHPDLKEKLLAINEPIVFHNIWGETFWGIYNGQGSNHLGKCLERVKAKLAKTND